LRGVEFARDFNNKARLFGAGAEAIGYRALDDVMEWLGFSYEREYSRTLAAEKSAIFKRARY